MSDRIDQIVAALAAALLKSSVSTQSPPVQAAPASQGYVYMSDRIDQIVAALAAAQIEILNPTKNKTASVFSKRTGATFQYSYATLDQVLEAVRVPLAKNGLAIVQLPIGKVLTTQLVHASGQWFRSAMDINPEEAGAQAFGSQIAYARRYAILSMLMLASEDDDDGAAASPGHNVAAHSRRSRGRQPEAPQEAMHPMAAMLERARNTSTIADAKRLIQAWAEECSALDALDPEEWKLVFGEVGNAIARAFKMPFAEIWRRWEQALEPGHVAWIMAKYDSGWRMALDGLREQDADAYELFKMQEERSKLRISVNPIVAEPKGAPEPDAPEPPPTREQPVADGPFAYALLDEMGNEISEPITKPAQWAMAFATTLSGLYGAPPGDERATAVENLYSHNGNAFAVAFKDPAAKAILMATEKDPALPAQEQPAQEPGPVSERSLDDLVVPLSTGQGRINVIGYLDAITVSLGDMTAAEMPLWEKANHDTIHSAELGNTTRQRVALAVAKRKRALGILPGDPAASA